MEIDEDGRDRPAQAVPGQNVGSGAERAVERVHEQAAHRLQHQGAAPSFHLDQRGTRARCAGWKIHRADQARGLGDVGYDLFAIPGVIAECDHVGAGGEQRIRHIRGETEAVRGVLGVDHRKLDAKRVRSPGSLAATASRPVRPTTSPMNRMRIRFVLAEDHAVLGRHSVESLVVGPAGTSSSSCAA